MALKVGVELLGYDVRTAQALPKGKIRENIAAQRSISYPYTYNTPVSVLYRPQIFDEHEEVASYNFLAQGATSNLLAEHC